MFVNLFCYMDALLSIAQIYCILFTYLLQKMKGFNCCFMIVLGRNMSGLFLTALCERKKCFLFKAFQRRETLKMYFTLSAHSAHANRKETGKNRKVKLA